MSQSAPRLCPNCSKPVQENIDRCLACSKKRPPHGWPVDERIGAKLLGGIVLTKRLGHGVTGSIYLGEDPESGEKIAVKFLHPEMTKDPEVVKRFKVEAVVTKSLALEQVVKTYDFGVTEDDHHYLTMEYVDGRPLDVVMNHYGALSLSQALEIARQVLVALEVAHRKGVVHRDLKPGNILLALDEDERPLVKILDFGFAKVLTDDKDGFLKAAKVTRDHLVLGTPLYMSPEQATGDAGIDGRTDLYSLGVILYRMITGVPPFEASSTFELMKMQIEETPALPSKKRAGVLSDMDRIVMRLMAKKPQDRYETAAAVLEDLDRAFPAGATSWDFDKMAAASSDTDGLIADMGRYVEDEDELRELAGPGRAWGPIIGAIVVGVTILVIIALIVIN